MRSKQLVRLGERVEALGGKQPFWAQPMETNGSVLLMELYAEWLIHYFTATKTLIALHSEFARWTDGVKEQNETASKVADLGYTSLHNLAQALEARSFVKILELSLNIMESAAKVSALGPLLVIFEAKGVIEKLIKTSKAKKSELTAVEASLALVEESMRQLLFLSLWAEAQVGSLTGRFPMGSTLANWRSPVVARMMKTRKDLVKSDFKSNFLRFDPKGFWHAGLND